MKKILLVEDDEIYASFIKKKLEKTDKYVIDVYSNAEHCLQELNHKAKPDIIIIDYFLPGMNGIELYSRIKESFESMKLIMISSNTDPDLVVDMVKKGIRNYVIKDVNVFESLVALIEENDDLFIDLYSK